jgi:hypothetical protein
VAAGAGFRRREYRIPFLHYPFMAGLALGKEVVVFLMVEHIPVLA